MKRYFFLLTLSVPAFGQLVLRDNDKFRLNDAEIENVSHIPAPSFKFPVPNLTTYEGELTWQQVAQIKIASFLFNTRAYGGDSAVICAYSVFGLSNLGEDISNEMRSEDGKVKEAFYSIYKNRNIHNQIFGWVKPSLSDAWKRQTMADKNTLKALMDYVISYLKSFDLKAETAYLEKLKQSNKEYEFCNSDIKGAASPFRKGAAWCYRRIAAGHMDAAYLLGWCTRIKKEIMAL